LSQNVILYKHCF